MANVQSGYHYIHRAKLLLCVSMVLVPQVVSAMVGMKDVVFRRSSMLPSYSCTVSPWGHCCLLA